MEGLSGNAGGSSKSRGAGSLADCLDCTSPTKRMPLREMVRISRCSSPESPTALRAALMRLTSVESDTIRPPQIAAIRSSLLTTRLGFCKR
jgi:hypothetical protein